MNANLLDVFIIAMSVAVFIQLLVLVGLLLSVRRSASRMEALADELRTHGVPALASLNSILRESRGAVRSIVENAQTASTVLRNQAERLDATLSDVVDRTRLQVIRVDEMTTRALDRVEDTAENVQGSLTAPARHLAGVLQGVTVGLDAFFRGNRHRRRGMGPEEEMFI